MPAVVYTASFREWVASAAVVRIRVQRKRVNGALQLQKSIPIYLYVCVSQFADK